MIGIYLCRNSLADTDNVHKGRFPRSYFVASKYSFVMTQALGLFYEWRGTVANCRYVITGRQPNFAF